MIYDIIYIGKDLCLFIRQLQRSSSPFCQVFVPGMPTVLYRLAKCLFPEYLLFVPGMPTV